VEVGPKVWLADVFGRIAEIVQSRLHQLLPWEWKAKAVRNRPGCLKTVVIIIAGNGYPRARNTAVLN